jgi:hypothetical protein
MQENMFTLGIWYFFTFNAIAMQSVAFLWRLTRSLFFLRLSRGSADILQDFYLKLRKRSIYADGTPITARQLESLVRLAEARARVDLREEVTVDDAQVRELGYLSSAKFVQIQSWCTNPISSPSRFDFFHKTICISYTTADIDVCLD